MSDTGDYDKYPVNAGYPPIADHISVAIDHDTGLPLQASQVVPNCCSRYERQAMTKWAAQARKRPSRASRGGVDLTLIRWMVRLTPAERLAVLQDHIKVVSALRRAATTD